MANPIINCNFYFYKYRFRHRLGTGTVLKVSIWYRYQKKKKEQYPILVSSLSQEMFKSNIPFMAISTRDWNSKIAWKQKTESWPFQNY